MRLSSLLELLDLIRLGDVQLDVERPLSLHQDLERLVVEGLVDHGDLDVVKLVRHARVELVLLDHDSPDEPAVGDRAPALGDRLGCCFRSIPPCEPRPSRRPPGAPREGSGVSSSLPQSAMSSICFLESPFTTAALSMTASASFVGREVAPEDHVRVQLLVA